MSRRKPTLITKIIAGCIAFGHAVSHRSRSARHAQLLARSHIGQIDAMDGVEFENYLEVLFRTEGYVIERTPASQDYGADLILHRHRGHQRIACRPSATTAPSD